MYKDLIKKHLEFGWISKGVSLIIFVLYVGGYILEKLFPLVGIWLIGISFSILLVHLFIIRPFERKKLFYKYISNTFSDEVISELAETLNQLGGFKLSVSYMGALGSLILPIYSIVLQQADPSQVFILAGVVVIVTKAIDLAIVKSFDSSYYFSEMAEACYRAKLDTTLKKAGGGRAA